MSQLPAGYFTQNRIANISQVLQKAYREVPDQEIVRLLFSNKPDLPISYRRLIQKSTLYSQALQGSGVLSNEVVILILQHGEDLLSAFFGAILAGATPAIMPFLTEKLQPEHYRMSLAALFAITRPAAVITYSEFLADARKASADSSVRLILVAEEIASAPTGKDSPDLPPFSQWRGLSLAGTSLALLQHSSGTTGLQKGVALSHRSIFHQLESYSQALRLTTEDVIVSWLPLYHDMGLIAGFLLPILLRIPLVLISPFDWVRSPQRLLQAIHRFDGTLCWLPNFAYNFCAQKIRSQDLENIDLSSLRAVINCSEPMHWKSHALFLERFQPYGLRKQALATSYAMAENVFAVTQGGIDQEVKVDTIDRQIFLSSQKAIPLGSDPDRPSGETAPEMRLLSAGRPIAGTQIRIHDPDAKKVPERTVGEIAIKSNCLLTGYYHRSDLTESAFRDGWYLTGDLGYLADGELFVTGRKKDLIIVGGKNIYPQDLESLASEVEGVHPGRVVAFGMFNENTGTEEVVLVAELEDRIYEHRLEIHSEQNISVEGIGREIRQRVTRGSDVSLRNVHLVERNWLIKTSSGKIARSANKAKYLAEVNP